MLALGQPLPAAPRDKVIAAVACVDRTDRRRRTGRRNRVKAAAYLVFGSPQLPGAALMNTTTTPRRSRDRSTRRRWLLAPRRRRSPARSAPARSANLMHGAPGLRAADYKALVCVFLYGGNDGMNMIVPTDTARYDQYAAVRKGLAMPQGAACCRWPAATTACTRRCRRCAGAWADGQAGAGVQRRPAVRSR